MVKKVRYVPGPVSPGTDAVFIPGVEYQKKERRFPIVVIIAVVLILAIIIVTIILVRSIKRKTLNVTSGDDIINLTPLPDLKSVGLCCKPSPTSNQTSKEFIYSPPDGYTYSTTPTQPETVCSSLTGVDNQVCINYVTGPDGKPRVLAHYGIVNYYAFAPGQASNVCDDYVTCP